MIELSLCIFNHVLSCSEMADTNDAEVWSLWGGEAEMTHPGSGAGDPGAV